MDQTIDDLVGRSGLSLNDLDAPSGESVATLYSTLREELLPGATPLTELAGGDSEKLKFLLFGWLKEFFPKIGYTGFSLRDVVSPTPRRLSEQLDALAKYLDYRIQQSVVAESKVATPRLVLRSITAAHDKLAQLEADYETLDARLDVDRETYKQRQIWIDTQSDSLRKQFDVSNKLSREATALNEMNQAAIAQIENIKQDSMKEEAFLATIEPMLPEGGLLSTSPISVRAKLEATGSALRDRLDDKHKERRAATERTDKFRTTLSALVSLSQQIPKLIEDAKYISEAYLHHDELKEDLEDKQRTLAESKTHRQELDEQIVIKTAEIEALEAEIAKSIDNAKALQQRREQLGVELRSRETLAQERQQQVEDSTTELAAKLAQLQNDNEKLRNYIETTTQQAEGVESHVYGALEQIEKQMKQIVT